MLRKICRKARVVLGSDTVVAADGKILGKPKSHEEAYEMIKDSRDAAIRSIRACAS